MKISRRKFIQNAGTAAIVAPITPFPFNILKKDRFNSPLNVSVFSKHLQFLDLKQAGGIAAELGFDGLDLTVRPKGHILPENVTTSLPQAIQEIRQAGSDCNMITTAITDVENELDVNLIKVAASEGIKYYRCNWYKYKEELTLEESLIFYREKVRQLSDLNKEQNIIGCYQNHSGMRIGASVWEVKKILETAEPRFFGVQYDIRHAVVEGGKSWPNGVELLKNNIKTIVLKDFKWGKVNGKWSIINVPIGEGMVDFLKYFRILKNLSLNPPTSLHLEYPLGGAEKGHSSISVDKKIIFDAMRKDLNRIHQLWKQA